MTSTRREFARSSAAGLVLLGVGARHAEADSLRAEARALRAAVRGRVLVAGDHGYPRSATDFNRRSDGVRPPAVVLVRDRPTSKPSCAGPLLQSAAGRPLGGHA